MLQRVQYSQRVDQVHQNYSLLSNSPKHLDIRTGEVPVYFFLFWGGIFVEGGVFLISNPLHTMKGSQNGSRFIRFTSVLGMLPKVETLEVLLSLREVLATRSWSSVCSTEQCFIFINKAYIFYRMFSSIEKPAIFFFKT